MNATYPPSRSTRSARLDDRSGERDGVRVLSRSATFAPAMDPPLWMDAVSSASVACL